MREVYQEVKNIYLLETNNKTLQLFVCYRLVGATFVCAVQWSFLYICNQRKLVITKEGQRNACDREFISRSRVLQSVLLNCAF